MVFLKTHMPYIKHLVIDQIKAESVRVREMGGRRGDLQMLG